MKIYNNTLYINFGNNTNHKNKNYNIFNNNDEDSFEYKKQPTSEKILSKIMHFFNLGLNRPEDIEENKFASIRYNQFISNAKQKMDIAKSEYKNTQEKAAILYDSANLILEKTKSDNIDENIKLYSIEYKGDKYKTISTINQHGLIDKIIQIKNDKIRAIYDIKSLLPYKDYNDNINADCYFYNDNNIEFRKNIKNDARNFFMVYDTEKGGMKKVKKNKNNNPIEALIKMKKDGAGFTYWFSYGSNNEEKVSFSDFGGGKTRTIYTKKQKIGRIKKFTTVKNYIQYENIEQRSENRLIIYHPQLRIQDYRWND